MNDKETCENCHFRVRLNCRRYPPVKVGNHFLYPSISLDLNCGEWKQRTDEDSDD